MIRLLSLSLCSIISVIFAQTCDEIGINDNKIPGNRISDYVLAADPGSTKVGFFYNQVNDIYLPLNQSDLNQITDYMTIGSIGPETEIGSEIKYFKSPDFRTVRNIKNISDQWIGARSMTQRIIDQWLIYQSLRVYEPTNVWDRILRACFHTKNNQIELYQYTALVPSLATDTLIYTFSWKIKEMRTNYCYQSIYSLTHDTIVCQGYMVDCKPPFY
jgi:hypothetical protein